MAEVASYPTRGEMLPMLRTKLQRLADGLTSEERAQLRAASAANDVGEPLPSLRADRQADLEQLLAEGA